MAREFFVLDPTCEGILVHEGTGKTSTILPGALQLLPQEYRRLISDEGNDQLLGFGVPIAPECVVLTRVAQVGERIEEFYTCVDPRDSGTLVRGHRVV
jgi:hypothetical protein